MAKIETLQHMISDMNKKMADLSELIEEKSQSIKISESQIEQLQQNLKADKLQLAEFEKQLNGIIELKNETDDYYKQIESNISTLMTILTSSRM
jgi:chromosome segregation ATPase